MHRALPPPNHNVSLVYGVQSMQKQPKSFFFFFNLCCKATSPPSNTCITVCVCAQPPRAGLGLISLKIQEKNVTEFRSINLGTDFVLPNLSRSKASPKLLELEGSPVVLQ